MKLHNLTKMMGEAAVDVADNVVRQSRQLSSQARLQLMLQRLEIDRRKALRELGSATYALYESSDLAGAGTSQRVADLCGQLDLMAWQSSEANRQIEEIKLARAAGRPEEEHAEAEPVAAPDEHPADEDVSTHHDE